MKQRIALFMLMIATVGGLFFLTSGDLCLNKKPSLTLNSSSLEDGKPIAREFTYDGKNISPALSWHTSIKDSIKSYVLIVDDPDAQKVIGKTFVHWLVVLSPETTNLPEGISQSIQKIDSKAAELMNDESNSYYNGPRPPAESGIHTYRFTVFATTRTVDQMIQDLKTVINSDDFEKGMNEYIIAKAQITGTYSR